MATNSSGSVRAGRFAGIAAAVAFVLGPTVAFLGIASPMTGFGVFGLAGLLALVTIVLGLVTAARAGMAAAGPSLGLGIGLVVAFLVVAMPGCGVPRINDITTSPTAPPEFERAGSLPGNEGRDMSYPGESFAAQQRDAYPDLAPLRLDAAPAEAFASVERVARDTPRWEITRIDSEQRQLEGVATSRVFRFRDDFIVAVEAADGGGSVVQMRSKSRDGKSDLGANAARIQSFFERLQADTDG